MTTPAGEDRLLDLDAIERAVAKFGFTDAKNLDSDDDELGRTRIYNRDGWFTIPTSERYFVAAAPDWLARLCARVRHLEDQQNVVRPIDAEHQHLRDVMVRISKAVGHDDAFVLEMLCKEGESPAEKIASEVESLRAASQRLTEALPGLRRKHLMLEEDCWYSCPLALRADGTSHCCNEDAPPVCTCGASAHNAKIDALLGAGAPPEGEK